MAEQSGKLLLADRRLAELDANMHTKRETENKEMVEMVLTISIFSVTLFVKQLKSIMKQEVAALDSKVRETHSTCFQHVLRVL